MVTYETDSLTHTYVMRAQGKFIARFTHVAIVYYWNSHGQPILLRHGDPVLVHRAASHIRVACGMEASAAVRGGDTALAIDCERFAKAIEVFSTKFKAEDLTRMVNEKTFLDEWMQCNHPSVVAPQKTVRILQT